MPRYQTFAFWIGLPSVAFQRRSIVSQVGGKLGVKQSLVESAEGSIVPVSQRTPAGNDVAILFVTDGLELPYAVNKFQVTHMLILVSQDAIDAVIEPAEGQLIQGISPFSNRRQRRCSARWDPALRRRPICAIKPTT